MNLEQLQALRNLSQALDECDRLGVLDQVALIHYPDTVNDFCDAVYLILLILKNSEKE